MHNYIQALFLTACVVITSHYQVAAQDELIFLTTTRPTETTTRPTARPGGDWVLVNNMPVQATMAPFLAAPPAATQQFLTCFGSCPTTPEYNPICANNRQLYLNEQKFNCARFCGADIQIVRRGSCEGLFPMQRG